MSWQYDYTNRTIDEQEVSDRLARTKPGGLSRRTYHFLTGAIVAASLLVIGLEYTYCLNNPWIIESLNFAFVIACYVVPFAGIIIMALAGREHLGLMVVGYCMVTLTLGFLMAIVLTEYTAASIQRAILITAIIAISFATLGFIRPDIFRRLYVVCFWGLTAMIIIELVMLLLGVHHTWQDWVVIAIFCGFIGYDFYNAANDEPTVDNAIIYACDIFLDIVNVFLRILNIAGERKR